MLHHCLKGINPLSSCQICSSRPIFDILKFAPKEYAHSCIVRLVFGNNFPWNSGKISWKFKDFGALPPKNFYCQIMSIVKISVSSIVILQLKCTPFARVLHTPWLHKNSWSLHKIIFSRYVTFLEQHHWMVSTTLKKQVQLCRAYGLSSNERIFSSSSVSMFPFDHNILSSCPLYSFYPS